jgi:hypothetical protein
MNPSTPNTSIFKTALSSKKTSMDAEVTDLVTVSRAELEELRKLKADLPAIIAQSKLDRDKENLARLTQMHKDNPERHRENAKKRYQFKKEEILAKKKEAYQRKKAAKEAAKASAETPGSSSS